MDFIDGLPNSNGKTTIFVVVDRLSKAVHFIPISHPCTATSVAQIFFNHVFKLYGMPKSIVVYGRAPPTLLSYIPGTTRVESIDWELQDRDQVRKQLREQLQLSQNRMKKAYDIHRTEKNFNVGDLEYLRLQPYCQVSVALRRNLKRSPRYYGLFEVIQKIEVGTTTVVQKDLPISQAILVRRIRKHQEEVLVHWTGLTPSKATWENLKTLKLRFPENTLEDKGDF
ncbi:hypothetical protein AMTRI_Chr03g140230 [Amborella trichopoda]